MAERWPGAGAAVLPSEEEAEGRLAVHVSRGLVGGGATRIVLDGTIDDGTVDFLRTRFAAIPKRAGSRVVVDMERVRYVNMAGLACFVGLSNRLRSAGAEVAYVRLPPPILTIVEMLGLRSWLAVRESTENGPC